MSKSQNNRIPRLAKKNKFIKQIIKSKNQKTQGTQIIEYNLGNEFQIFWNFLKKRLNSIVIKAKGIARAAQGVLKKPIDEALIQEILSINNEQDSKTFDYLEYQERDSDSSEFESYEYSQIFRSI